MPAWLPSPTVTPGCRSLQSGDVDAFASDQVVLLGDAMKALDKDQKRQLLVRRRAVLLRALRDDGSAQRRGLPSGREPGDRADLPHRRACGALPDVDRQSPASSPRRCCSRCIRCRRWRSKTRSLRGKLTRLRSARFRNSSAKRRIGGVETRRQSCARNLEPRG